MDTSQKIGLGVGLALIAFLSALIGGTLSGSVAGGQTFSGAYEAIPKWFGNGLSAGLSEQWTVDESGIASTTAVYKVNGVTVTMKRANYTTSTTTVCAIQAPTAASSTLRYGTASFTTSSTTASTVTIAKAATAFATTTAIATSSIAANGMATIVAATTTFEAALTQEAERRKLADLVFAPGEWIVVGMAGGTGTFSPVGACVAEWVSTN